MKEEKRTKYKGVFQSAAIVALGLFFMVNPAKSTNTSQAQKKDVSDYISVSEIDNQKQSSEWKFVVMGDTHGGHKDHRENIEGIINKIPNDERVTLIHCGDLTIRGWGGQWKKWKHIIKPLEIDWNKKDPPEYIGIVGNHDTRGSSWNEKWKKYLPAQRGLSAYDGIKASQDGVFGSVKYDNAIFIWLDSDTKPKDQEQFLKNTLERATDDSEIMWKFVMMHHPPLSCGRYGEWEPGNSWVDKYFIPNDVDIVFSGHIHYYERTCTFTSLENKLCDETNRGDIIKNPKGTMLIITGGGGGLLRKDRVVGTKVGGCGWLDSSWMNHHFLEIEVNGNQLNGYVWDTDMKEYEPTLVDEFTIIKK